ncbi:MAG TPA: Rieske 2Fe-2S domain-containing protein [Pirellulales bacterium]|jgi:Rieske Fe-S protein|nr:Rieske 2Fe-2S domain-containing protein [Pirellulales bacterium]
MTTIKTKPSDLDRPTSGSDVGLPVRRSFFRRLTFAAGGVAAALASVPIIGYFFRTPEPTTLPWIDLGPISGFRKGETRLVTFDNPLRQPWDGVTAHTGVFVRNEGAIAQNGAQFLVLAINCAHLGCPVTWFPESGLFMCPCHGGVYYADGERASGPPPRGLFQCIWRISGGRLQIQAPRFPTLQDTLKDEPKSA